MLHLMELHALKTKANVYIGLTQAEVAALATANQMDWRISAIDSDNFMLTCDYRLDRVTAD